jgi:hypothetical protein
MIIIYLNYQKIIIIKQILPPQWCLLSLDCYTVINKYFYIGVGAMGMGRRAPGGRATYGGVGPLTCSLLFLSCVEQCVDLTVRAPALAGRAKTRHTKPELLR